MDNHLKLDVLFISQRATWPLDQGFCVHGTHMALALTRQGLRVGLASMESSPADPPPWLRPLTIPWPSASAVDHGRFLRGWSGVLGRPRARLARYLGPDSRILAGILPLLKRHQPKALIGLGLHSLLALRAVAQLRDAGQVEPVRCLWYAADEMVNFHLSCLRREPVRSWPGRLSRLAQHAALEGLFAHGLDGAIGVSPRDARLLQTLAGVRRSVVIRNGVDLDYFQPQTLPTQVIPRSLVFWGRLDFEPNVDGVCWFAREVWPRLRTRWPDARWQIIGKNATPAVRQLAAIPGIEMLGEVADLRPFAAAAELTILPTRCGGGIKNKLLEAAALGRPIVASPTAVAGLEFDAFAPPFVICSAAAQWEQAIRRLWADEARRSDLQRKARRWVEQAHNWNQAARELRLWLEGMGCRWDMAGPTLGPSSGLEALMQRAASILPANQASSAQPIQRSAA